MPRRALHQRESSGVAWGVWSMDLWQAWLGRSANHLRWSFAPPFVHRNYPFVRVSGPSRRPSSDPPGPENARWSGNETRRVVPKNNGRRGRPSQVICGPSEPILAEIHQPSAPRDPQIFAMVQCATRQFEQKPAGGGQPFAFLTQFFIYVRIGSDGWDFHIFVQIDSIKIDI